LSVGAAASRDEESLPALTDFPPAVPRLSKIREIEASDVSYVAELLGRGLGYPPTYYRGIFAALDRRPAPSGCPQRGLLVEVDGRVIGALVLIYSRGLRAPSAPLRCHVTSFYVEPSFEVYGAMLALRATNRKDVTFVNLSARPNIRKFIEAQGFRKYVSGQFVAILPWHALESVGGVELTAGALPPPGECSEIERDMVAAHVEAGCICLWATLRGRSVPLIMRPKRFKNRVPGAQILYCPDTQGIKLYVGALSRFLLRRGMLLLSVDANGPISGLHGHFFEGVEPRFVKGQQPQIGDLAFTLNALVPFHRRPL
jgi:hypothetical protein